ncbi:uncharacterized protein LOC124156657 [Ischnura elegans]|uniref:uncharacterized protein LOC124156657 n=1 Tax=Ischnura elegans TaxID=197161 RepID=UPI001ED86D1B|nr:uncharacterized protein LOC124156657 [Ischnura elegans]
MHRSIRRLEQLRKDRANHLSHLAFLLRCRDEKIVPRFAVVKLPVHSPAAERIAKRTSFALVRERIHYHRSCLDSNAKGLLELHYDLAARLTPFDWDFVDRTTMAQGETLLNRNTERQKRKFKNLTRQQKTPPPAPPERVIVNLTEEELDKDLTAALSKGLNFVPTPKRIPYMDIIGGVEGAIRKLPQEEAEEIRNEVSAALKRAVIPKSNVSIAEKRALTTIKKNPNIVVLQADKGNATVLMKTVDYQEKLRSLLNGSTYRPITRDPTDSLVRKTAALIKRCIPENENTRTLMPQAPVPPRMYGLPKIHKDGIPLRPIVSAIGSPTYNLARHLTNLLSPFVGQCEHHVTDSKQFVQTLKSIRLEETDILASFDVVSLFTRIPVEETTRLLETRFDRKTVELFQHVLRSTYFLCNGQFYEQTEGVPMGSPLSPAIANLFMEDFEEKA